MKKVLLSLCLGLVIAQNAHAVPSCGQSLMPAFTANQATQLCSVFGSSVNHSLIPSIDNTYDLGSASKQWRSEYLGTNLIFGAASAKIIPGATSLLFRNNADSASNLTIADAGPITMRSTSGAYLNVPINGIFGTTTTTFTNIDSVVGAVSSIYGAYDATAKGGLVIASKGATANGGLSEYFHSRGDFEGSTIVNSADKIARWRFFGSTGAPGYAEAASIIVTVDGTPGAGTDMPGAIDFQTSPDGSATPASVLKLDNAKLATFTGAIKSTANTLGWQVRSAGNQACTTTCGAGKGCAFGYDIAGTTLVDCSSANADSCVCSF